VLDHDHVQALGRRAPVLIDKTGTLTLGRPHITDMITVDGHTDNALLALAAVIAGFAKDDALCVGRRAGARSLRYRDVEPNSALHRVTSRCLPKSPDKHSPPRQSVI
jgi:hypothetical protein